MLARGEIVDLYELLCDGDTSSSSSENTIQSGRRKYRNKKRYETAKVFKSDIRWSYCNMFLNVLSSSDVYLMYDFLSTYAVADMQHTYDVTKEFGGSFSKVGIGSYLKQWVLNTCSAPDIVYKIEQPNVRNFIDGTSEISFRVTLCGNFIYEKPSFEGGDCLKESEEAVGQKRMLIGNSDRTNKPGVRVFSPYGKQRRRIRVGKSCDESNSEDCDLLEALDSLMLTTISSYPVRAVSCGRLTMKLDSNNRIISTVYTFLGDCVIPIALGDL